MLIAFLLLAAVLSVYVHAPSTSQVPLSSESHSPPCPPDDDAQWSLDQAPGPESSSIPLLFDSITSLLQRWQNTRYRNGHTIVPGVIPPGTLLYHGRRNSDLPKAGEAEWVALDPELSLLFTATNDDGSGERKGGWHLTMITKRELQVLYFDGSSAAKMPFGSMDSQDVLLWGEVKEDNFFEEKERLEGLCRWGKEVGLDGFVRMEMDFEIMLCDFESGVEVVSFEQLESLDDSDGPPPAPDFSTDPPSSPPSSPPVAISGKIPGPPAVLRTGIPRTLTGIQNIIAGSWHNHYPGETRIQLVYTRLISFYDEGLVPSLVRFREGEGVTRYEHRLKEISREDVEGVRRRLEGVVRARAGGKKGGEGKVDWKTMFWVVIERYAGRLEDLEYFLFESAGKVSLDETIEKVSGYLKIMLAPYILRSASPPPRSPGDDPAHSSHAWAEPVWKLCAETHMKYVGKFGYEMTESEVLMRSIILGTEKDICRVLVRMWAIWKKEEEETVGQDEGGIDEESAEELVDMWRDSVEGLMKWLDWGVWAKCKPDCGAEELCYMPTWPFFNPPRTESQGYGDEDDDEEWARPRPRCVRRMDPFGEKKVDADGRVAG